MPGFGNTEFNLVDVNNSSTTTLGILGVFLGTFTDVTGYTTVTFTASADLPALVPGGIQFQWSTNGVDIDAITEFEDIPLVLVGGKVTVHSTIRAKYFRVRYQASGLGQSFTRLQTLLRKGTISGGVSEVGRIDGKPDAQIVNSVSFGERQDGEFAPAGLRDTNFWIVFPYPNLDNHIRQTIVATTGPSAQLDFFGFNVLTRRTMTIFNDTTRGNLYVRFGGVASLALYDFKIAPQATWTLPPTWIPYGGTVFGIWDEADGVAHVLETTTGVPL